MTVQRALYAPLLAINETEDKTQDELPGSDEALVRQSPRSPHKVWLLHLGIFVIYTIAFLVLSARRIFEQNLEKIKDTCFLEQSTYSPAYEAIEYSVVTFNGSLEHPSPYKGPQTPAVAKAWNRIMTNNSLWPIRLSEDELKRIGKAGRPSNVRYKEADGGGSMATLEVFHQLHCLNLLRTYTYPDDYPEVQELWQTRPKLLRAHLDHCIDIIRQNLMCNADVTVITYDWLGGWEVPFPDFNTYHKCRNFDAILDWMTKNRVHIPQDHMTRIGHEIDLPEWHPPD